MMLLSSYVIFRVLNFILLILFSWYIFNKYIRPWTTNALVARKKELTGFKKQKNALISQIKDIKCAVKEQDSYRMRITQLSQLWNNQINSNFQKRAQQKLTLEMAIEKQLKMRSIWLSSREKKQYLMPLVLERATNELKKHFSDTKKGSLFVKEIASYLKEQAKHEAR